MDSLRLILILAGLLIVLAIYLFGRRQEQKSSDRDLVESSTEKSASSPATDDWDSLSFSTLDSDPLDDNTSPLLATLREGARAQRQKLEDAALDSLKLSSTEDNIEELSLTGSDEVREQDEQGREWFVVLTVMANEGNRFQGETIHKALHEADMHFGEMDIYHDYAAGTEGVSLTSIANILEPGSLKPDEQDKLETPGLLMLLRLPTILDGREALDRMLGIAKELADKLDGHVCDQQRHLLSDDVIEEMRKKAKDYPVLPVLSAEVD